MASRNTLEPRGGLKHRFHDRPDEFQESRLPRTHHGQGGYHRHDPAAGDGRSQPWDSRQFDFPWDNRNQPNAREWAGYMLGKTLLGRLGRPEKVANVALFLACDESSYVTGVDVVVDGVMKVW
jgi:hypothetical protein